MRSLSAALARTRHALTDAAARLAGDGAAPVAVTATVVAEGSRGVRRVRIRGHALLSDTTPKFGGDDLGPSPQELQLAALGACMAQAVVLAAAERLVAIDDVQVQVTGRIDSRDGRSGVETVRVGFQGLTLVLTLRSQAPGATIEALVREAERASLVLRLVRASQEVRLVVRHDPDARRAVPIYAMPS